MKLTHLSSKGEVHMVDVGKKEETARFAIARGRIIMRPETLKLIMAGEMKKGDVFNTAKIAGILAAKKTAEIIPLCHPLNITHIDIQFIPLPDENAIEIESKISIVGRTGVEMEALTAVAIAALTIYDMSKAVDKEMRITDIRLIQKSGGRSGNYICSEQTK
ncbi:MAG: cyclic pyranopterin monophosphate synthase MoaC [Candidatus Desulfofervidus auxilii]|nr:cyclic pyranopterin monophosphate synthase MoaC [Candidatus Desulfofervidus auxilii]